MRIRGFDIILKSPERLKSKKKDTVFKTVTYKIKVQKTKVPSGGAKGECQQDSIQKLFLSKKENHQSAFVANCKYSLLII